MSIILPGRMSALGLALLVAAGPFAVQTAGARTSAAMTACSAQYKADKAAGSLATGQTWPQYLSACAAKLGGTDATAAAAAPLPTVKPMKAAQVAAAAAGAPATVAPAAAAPVAKAPKLAAVKAAPAPVAAAAAGTKTPTPGQQAMYDRERQCGTMWKAAKAAGSVPASETWPQYWSQCNTQLKG